MAGRRLAFTHLPAVNWPRLTLLALELLLTSRELVSHRWMFDRLAISFTLGIDSQLHDMKKRTSSRPEVHFIPRGSKALNWPRVKLREFREILFQPVDALPLGIFRFLFGLVLCVEFLVLSRETFPSDYIKPSFHFTYPLFDLVGLKPCLRLTSGRFSTPSNSPRLVSWWDCLRVCL